MAGVREGHTDSTANLAAQVHPLCPESLRNHSEPHHCAFLGDDQPCNLIMIEVDGEDRRGNDRSVLQTPIFVQVQDQSTNLPIQ